MHDGHPHAVTGGTYMHPNPVIMQASPLQCSAIADSCLAMGAATCRAAATAINKAIQEQKLGPKAAGGKASLKQHCVNIVAFVLV